MLARHCHPRYSLIYCTRRCKCSKTKYMCTCTFPTHGISSLLRGSLGSTSDATSFQLLQLFVYRLFVHIRSPKLDCSIIADSGNSATAIRADVCTHDFPFMPCHCLQQNMIPAGPKFGNAIKACREHVIPIIGIISDLHVACSCTPHVRY